MLFTTMPSIRSLLILALVAALAPIWITHREMWDGVTIEYAFETGDLSGLLHAVTASGWPMAGWIYKILWTLQKQLSIPYWLGIDILFTLALLGMAYEVFQLAHQRLGWRKNLCAVALALFLAQPIWHFLMSGIHIVHVTGLWFLLLGHRLTSHKQIIFKASGWVLVTLSFQFPVSIVMVFWLEWVLYVEAKKTQRQNLTRAILVALYAVAWYAASRTVFGPTQTFIGYNQLLLPTSLESIQMIIWTGLKFASWLLVLSAPLWAAIAWNRSSWNYQRVMQIGWTQNLGNRISSPYGIAIVGCMVAIAPYWAVGKGPVVIMPYDWTARNALPLAIPLSLLMALLIEKFAVISDLHKRLKRENSLLTLIVIWWIAMSLAGVAGKLYQIKLEKAIETSLRRLPPPPSGIVTLQLPFDPLIRIRQNEANGLFWRAYGRAEWAVLVGPPDKWIRLVRDSYVADRPEAVKNVSNFALWAKFLVMADLKNFDCETTVVLTLPHHQHGLNAWVSWLSWSPFDLTASMEKTTCP